MPEVSVQDPIRLKVGGEYGLSPPMLNGLPIAGLPILSQLPNIAPSRPR
jgi:hypothetical protein